MGRQDCCSLDHNGNNQMHASSIILSSSETRTTSFLDRSVFLSALLLATKEGLLEILWRAQAVSRSRATPG
jgi:hypothetical protein